MKKLLYYMLVLFISFFYSCKKEGRIDHIDRGALAPEQITDVKVTSTPGGAIITYKIPTDSKLSYVKAVYEIQPGVFREAKSSYYTDTLRIVGFGDTLSHEIKIFSVGRNEKESVPISVKIEPLLPSVRSVFPTLNMVSAFGGIQVSFENSSQAKLAITVLMKDPLQDGDWKKLTTFHTGAMEGRFSVRGLDSTKKIFGVFIRDRWNNKSDTLVKAISPIFEEFIPKGKWQALVLPNDQTEVVSSTYSLPKIWDGYTVWKVPQHAAYASSNASTFPQWFTIDLGEKVSISRIVEHQGYPYHIYNGSAVKVFELWGSNDPASDGSWASWDSLGTFHSFKPSGLPMGQVSAEDLEYGWTKGEDFEFDHVLPAYRYIRWKTLQTYSSSGQVVILEIDLYGQIQP